MDITNAVYTMFIKWDINKSSFILFLHIFLKSLFFLGGGAEILQKLKMALFSHPCPPRESFSSGTEKCYFEFHQGHI